MAPARKEWKDTYLVTITHRWPDYVPTNAPHDVRCTWYHHDDQVRCRHDECFEAALTRGEPQRPDSDFVLPPRIPLTLEEAAKYSNDAAMKAWIKRESETVLDIGLSPDAPRVVNDQGGSQSEVGTRFDLMHPGAMIRLAQLLKTGAEKYGEDNPGKIPTNDHLNHALLHIYAFLAGNTDDDHLTHALCRVLFALGGELDRA